MPTSCTALRVWAGLWSAVIGSVFAGVTVLTVTLWAADPLNAQTTPVVDLGFLALGGIVVAGLAGQVTRRSPSAGVWQSLLAATALAAAGLVGGRIEPFLGGLLLVLVAAVAWWLRPRPRPLLLRPGRPGRPSPSLAVLAAAAWVAGAAQATAMLGVARAAEPSCFLGRCVRGDRPAELAATAVTIAAVATLASLHVDGWPLPVWSAGGAAATVGAASVALPAAEGSLGAAGGVAAVLWAVLVVAVGERERAGGGTGTPPGRARR